MTKNEIVDRLAKDKTIETIIGNVCRGNAKDSTQDLAQDLYINLLEKDDDAIIKMYQSNQLQFFLTRMVLNNLCSTHSPYYYQYIKNDLNKTDLRDYPDGEEE